MALSKNSNSRKSNSKEMFHFEEVEVRRAHDFGNGRISFNADFKIGGVTVVSIYNLTWVEGSKGGRDYEFISMPQNKGSDGNYYNVCYIQVSDDLKDAIKSQLEDLLK